MKWTVICADSIDTLTHRNDRNCVGLLNLSVLLKGRSLDAYALMPSENALDCDKLKKGSWKG
jgi:hypothetical protein